MDAVRPMRIKEYGAIAIRAAEKAIGEPLLFSSKVIYDNFLKAIENETCMGLAAGER